MKMLSIARWVLVIFVLATPIIPTLIAPTILETAFSEELDPYAVDTSSLGYKMFEWIAGIHPLLAALLAFFAFPGALLILWMTSIFTGLNLMFPAEMEKVPKSAPKKQQVTLQTRRSREDQPKKPKQAPVQNSSPASLPPEVLAARRLAQKPTPKDTSGPTIFGENLISEKSLDEVILGYLAGNDDDKS